MKIIKHALLLSGLFFSSFTLADLAPNYDPNDFKPALLKEGICANAPPPLGGASKAYGCGQDQRTAVTRAAPAYAQDLQAACAQQSNRSNCSVTVSSIPAGQYPDSATFSMSYTYKCNLDMDQELEDCSSNNPNYRTQIFGIQKLPKSYTCPPTDPVLPESTNAILEKYKIGPIRVDGQELCFKPLDPLDCSALKGVGSSSLYDRFVVGSSVGYTYQNPPSCLTKCAKDENGTTRCADCKVVAPSWSRSVSGDGQTESWWANAGTFTGAACGETESEVPPPEAPKCWETTNGLSMCIQDPAEKCVTVSGVQQCEAGCGYVNEAFYCAEKEQEKPNPNDKDKPIPDPDDNISNPDKPLADMKKGDFKDVQRGVESRIVGVGVAVGNVENSVDALGNTLDSINKKLDTANGIGEAQLGYLKGIKDGVTGDDGGGEPDGNCDPLKDKKCDGNTGASGIKSWWNTKYPDGLGGLMTEKQDAFYQSEAYKAITFELTTGGGTLPVWNFCMNMGFADYGCKDLSLPSWLWGFIKACMMFGAAILARRLLIGA